MHSTTALHVSSVRAASFNERGQWPHYTRDLRVEVSTFSMSVLLHFLRFQTACTWNDDPQISPQGKLLHREKVPKTARMRIGMGAIFALDAHLLSRYALSVRRTGTRNFECGYIYFCVVNLAGYTEEKGIRETRRYRYANREPFPFTREEMCAFESTRPTYAFRTLSWFVALRSSKGTSLQIATEERVGHIEEDSDDGGDLWRHKTIQGTP